MCFRVFLVEDSAPMRGAIMSILGVECELLGWVDDGLSVLGTVVPAQPEVILLDISLPGVSGMSLLPQLRSSLPETGIVMLTNHHGSEYVAEAFLRGADGYVLKSEAHVSLLPAIRHAGNKYLSARQDQGRAGSDDARLNFREQQTLQASRAAS